MKGKTSLLVGAILAGAALASTGGDCDFQVDVDSDGVNVDVEDDDDDFEDFWDDLFDD